MKVRMKGAYGEVEIDGGEPQTLVSGSGSYRSYEIVKEDALASAIKAYKALVEEEVKKHG